MRHFACLFVGLMLLSSPGLAAKSAEKSAPALIKDGERLYQAGKYLEAVEALKKAHAIDPNPRLVYNIARAYDQAGDLPASLAWYQQYVSSTEGTDPVLLKRSALAIDRLRGLVKQQDEARAAQDAERKRLADEAELQHRRAEEQAEATQKARAESEVRRREALDKEVKEYERAKLGAYVFGGAALLGVATGVSFGVLANVGKGQFTKAETLADKQQLEQQTKQQALYADIGFGVGVAAAVAAVLLYPKGPAPQGPQARILIAPNGAGVEVRF